MIRGMRLSDRIGAEAKLSIYPENILDRIGRRYGSVFLPYIFSSAVAFEIDLGGAGRHGMRFR
jgi:hypothetical protein